MRSNASLLAPTFRSKTQGELLACVLLHPEQEWTLTELARRLDVPLTTIQGEVGRLIDGGVLSSRKIGRARLVRANVLNPAVTPLTTLTLMTFGPQTVIADEFATVQAERLVVFGSWAARYHGVPGALPDDIDVLVFADGVQRAEVYAAADRSQARLGMPVNPILRPTSSWDDPGADPLLLDVQTKPFVDLHWRVS
jgi:hypothetical protein